MKRILLLLAVVFLGTTQASAQCTPDPQYTEPGIYPDSATGFSAACVGVPYTQLITNVVPVDTCVEIIPGFPCQTVNFDSIVIVSFTGLPPSMSYACNSSLGGCSFAGGTTGCAIITGTPTLAEVGTHNLVITVDVYVGGMGSAAATEVIDWYYIDITDCAAGIGELKQEALSLYPNPAENSIQLTNVHGETVTITNVNGQVMKSVGVNGNTEMKLDVSEFANGVYFVQAGNETIRFVKK